MAKHWGEVIPPHLQNRPCQTIQEDKKLPLSGTKLALHNEIYNYKATLLLLLLYIIYMALSKCHNYFLSATNTISSDSPLILPLLLQK